MLKRSAPGVANDTGRVDLLRIRSCAMRAFTAR